MNATPYAPQIGASAVLGVVAALGQITGVAGAVFGHDVVFPLLASMDLAQLVLSVWLLTNGFARRRTPRPNLRARNKTSKT